MYHTRKAIARPQKGSVSLYADGDNGFCGQFPDLEELVSVTLIEASDHILGSFDQKLVNYVSGLLTARKVSTRSDSSSSY